jgi:hypothetical protein
LTARPGAVYALLVAVKRSAEVVGLLRTGDVRLLLARYADLALAALVVSIVGMMIVPLLDLLISVNIAAAVTLLLVAIVTISFYMGNSVKRTALTVNSSRSRDLRRIGAGLVT